MPEKFPDVRGLTPLHIFTYYENNALMLVKDSIPA